ADALLHHPGHRLLTHRGMGPRQVARTVGGAGTRVRPDRPGGAGHDLRLPREQRPRHPVERRHWLRDARVRVHRPALQVLRRLGGLHPLPARLTRLFASPTRAYRGFGEAKPGRGVAFRSMSVLIDADQHLFERRDTWREHIDPAQRDDALAIDDDELGWSWLTWRGQRLYLAENQ